MNNARIEQVGPPQEVYDKPATPFVFEFLGNVNRLELTPMPEQTHAKPGPVSYTHLDVYKRQALQNYFSSLPDLEFDYNYGDGDQLSHGHFAYSQGRYLIHVTGNQPDLESMFVFDGHRYSGLVQNARTILLSSNPQNCSLYFPDWFGSNPLFHPVAIFLSLIHI